MDLTRINFDLLIAKLRRQQILINLLQDAKRRFEDGETVKSLRDIFGLIDRIDCFRGMK